MGTHDLDTVKGPFTYEALRPEEVIFAPLNQTRVMNGRELMAFYEVCIAPQSPKNPKVNN